MSQYFIRSGGQVYGPYSQGQLSSLAAEGRVVPTTEVSTDRVTWAPASSLQPGGTSPQRASSSSSSSNRQTNYLAELRGRTHYPTYRAVVMIFSILGYIASALPIVGIIFIFISQGAIRFFEDPGLGVALGAVILSVVVAVSVKFYQEFVTMLVDFTDSTIDYHSRN